jgi:hypothetical protein
MRQSQFVHTVIFSLRHGLVSGSTVFTEIGGAAYFVSKNTDVKGVLAYMRIKEVHEILALKKR